MTIENFTDEEFITVNIHRRGKDPVTDQYPLASLMEAARMGLSDYLSADAVIVRSTSDGDPAIGAPYKHLRRVENGEHPPIAVTAKYGDQTETFRVFQLSNHEVKPKIPDSLLTEQERELLGIHQN